MIDAPLVVEDIRQADAIFSGSIVRYEIVSPGQAGSLDDYGLITVRVKDVIKGSLSGDVQLYWWNSTFGMPDTLLATDPALFAAVRPDGNSLPLRGASATIFPNRRTDLLQVLQAPCSEAFILPYNQSVAQKVREILNGSSVESQEMFEVDGNMTVREVLAIRRREDGNGMIVLAIAAALGLIAMTTFWAVRRKRLRRTAIS